MAEKTLDELDDFIPCVDEYIDTDNFFKDIKGLKNLYLYVTEKQLFSILEDKALKLSRTEYTNDTTENIYSGEDSVSPTVKEYGYICLSSTITSPMMWGQYAERGKGACLVFSSEFSIRGGYVDVGYHFSRNSGLMDRFKRDVIMRKVSYVSDRINNNKGNRYDLMSTKYFGWEHEQEYRIIVPLSSAHPKEVKNKKSSFSYIYLYNNIMPALSRVVLGVNNSLDEYDTERKINKSLLGPAPVQFPIRVVRASLAPSTFCISPNLDKIHQHVSNL
nr:MAG TPA: Protein of unknown function (DUF2971) [Caudoviricetes sp.]